jgi:hypothetical protein
MAVMAVGSMGAASQAFADASAPSISIEVDGDTFDHESTIVVDGQIGVSREGTPVTVIVTGQTGVVTIEQVTPSSDGSFSVSINTASPLMKYDGEYKIKATYGVSGINDVVFVTLEGGAVREASTSSHHEDAHEVADLTNELDYYISGGMVAICHAIRKITVRRKGATLFIMQMPRALALLRIGPSTTYKSYSFLRQRTPDFTPSGLPWTLTAIASPYQKMDLLFGPSRQASLITITPMGMVIISFNALHYSGRNTDWTRFRWR